MSPLLPGREKEEPSLTATDFTLPCLEVSPLVVHEHKTILYRFRAFDCKLFIYLFISILLRNTKKVASVCFFFFNSQVFFFFLFFSFGVFFIAQNIVHTSSSTWRINVVQIYIITRLYVIYVIND